MADKCEAAEYRFISERIKEWEEIYGRDEHHRERDIRDDLLTMYRRGVELQLLTIFELQSKVYPDKSGQAKGDLSGDSAHPAQVSVLSIYQKMERLVKRVEQSVNNIEATAGRIEDKLFGAIDRLLDKLAELVSILCGRGRHEHE